MDMMAGQSGKYVLYLLAVLSAAAYLYFAYFLTRSDFDELIGLYVLLFCLYLILYKRYSENLKIMAASALVFRLVFILAVPNLSQDFYRFIWDGRMIWSGLNPYLFTPDSFLQAGELPFSGGMELIEGMGHLSSGNHSNYPPLKQLCFAIAAGLSNGSIHGSVILMRLMIIGADIGTFFFGRRLLKALNLSENRIFLFLLNPFIIIELTGNLHFEGIMIFFLVWSLYLLHKGKQIWSAVLMAFSISIKLIPLMLLPLFFQKLRWNSLKYYTITGLVVLVGFLPFFSSELVHHFFDTTGLWFQKFEFNASLYYLAREIGYGFRGYNEIAIIGSYIPYIVLVCVLLLSILRNNKQSKDMIAAMVFALGVYFFLSTTVHPWYIATLLALSVFTPYRFALIWSFTIMLSYWAYGQPEFRESMYLIGLEYLVVFGFLIFELINFSRFRTSRQIS